MYTRNYNYREASKEGGKANNGNLHVTHMYNDWFSTLTYIVAMLYLNIIYMIGCECVDRELWIS